MDYQPSSFRNSPPSVHSMAWRNDGKQLAVGMQKLIGMLHLGDLVVKSENEASGDGDATMEEVKE